MGEILTARVRRKGCVDVDSARHVGEAERVPPAEAVARHGDPRGSRDGPRVGDGPLEDGLRGGGAVVADVEGAVAEAGAVHVRGRGAAVEQVRGDDEEAGAGERVGKAGRGRWLRILYKA